MVSGLDVCEDGFFIEFFVCQDINQRRFNEVIYIVLQGFNYWLFEFHVGVL